MGNHGQADYRAGDTVGGYRVEEAEPLEHLMGTYLELTHLKTAARHIHIACPEDNHTFGVMFPTVPQDSTGVAHILEHVVLAGSRRFPVRDPFFSMIPRSLKTFMNAMTSSDWTVYPFSTRNEKDFFNLLSIYLDAAFFPLITEEAFSQEGHRLEFEQLDDPSSGLRFKGVVFNEMKGAMASPQNVMYRGLGAALFPGLTYANNSGGDPEKIPDLTYGQLKQFHAVHYHPSNAYFFTYGSLPMDRLLAEIEDQALSHFDKSNIDIVIPDVRRFDSPRTMELCYPLSPQEPPRKKSQAVLAWVTNHVFNSFETLVLKVLEEVLLGNPASPLHRALIGSGLGDALADGSGYHTDFREAVFGAGLKGIDPEDREEVQQIVMDTLEQLCEQGLDESQIEAAIHQLEFDAREVSNQGFPYSLKVFFELSGAYIYGGDPYRALQFDLDLAKLAEARKKGRFFEGAIRRWLVDNSHRVLVTLRPDQEMEKRKTEEELRRLAEIEAGLSEQEKAAIVQRTARLKQEQEARQDLSSLPTLELADVPMKFESVDQRLKDLGNAGGGFFAQPTNGITYVDLRADFGFVADELVDYLPLFSYVLPKMGAAGDDYLAMANRISSYTGGIGSSASVRAVAAGGAMMRNWTFHGKALARNHRPFMAIMGDLLRSVEFDTARIKELVAELRVAKEASIVGAGTTYATYLAASKLSAEGVMDERLGGLTQLALLKQLDHLSVDEMESLVNKFQAILEALMSGGLLKVCVTSQERYFDGLQSLLRDTVGSLGNAAATGSDAPLRAPGALKHEARTTSCPVAFNARVFKAVRFVSPDAPALLSLAHFLRATYLHREIREKGGAYGAHASYDAEKGNFTFSSYRDPNISRTYDVFEESVSYVMKGGLDPDEVKEAVLSACGAVDPLESPDTKGRRRFFDDLAGYTLELRENFKKGLLSVTEEDLVRVAENYLSRDGACMATVAGPEQVEKANREMGGVFEVSPI